MCQIGDPLRATLARLRRDAGRLADAHGLRGCDAIHLASFETLLSRCDDANAQFLCADDRLSRAAQTLG